MELDANPREGPIAAPSTAGGQADGGGSTLAAVPSQPATGGGATPAEGTQATGTPGVKPDPLHTNPEFKGAIERKNQLAIQNQEAEVKLKATTDRLAFLNSQIEQVQTAASGQRQIPLEQVDETLRQPLEAMNQESTQLRQEVQNLGLTVFTMQKDSELQSVRDKLKADGLPDDVTDMIPEMDKVFAVYPKLSLWQIYWAVKGPRAVAQTKANATEDVLNRLKANEAASQSSASLPTRNLQAAEADYPTMLAEEYQRLTAG